jgi:hypothetical protein
VPLHFTNFDNPDFYFSQQSIETINMSKIKRSETDKPHVVVYHHHHFYHASEDDGVPFPMGPVLKKNKSTTTPPASEKSTPPAPEPTNTTSHHQSKKEWLAQRKQELYESYKSGQMFGKK